MQTAKVAAISDHQAVHSLTPGQQREFARLQLRLGGASTGMLKGVQYRPANHLSDKELLEKMQRFRDSVQRMMEFAQQFTTLGKSIAFVRDNIDENIEIIEDAIETLIEEDYQPAEKREKTVSRWKKARDRFVEKRNELDKIEDKRQKSTTTADIENVQSDFDDFTNGYDSFVDDFRRESLSSEFQTRTAPFDASALHYSYGPSLELDFGAEDDEPDNSPPPSGFSGGGSSSKKKKKKTGEEPDSSLS